jgi:hypothetical protein
MEADVTEDLDETKSNSELSWDDDIVRVEPDMLKCSEFLWDAEYQLDIVLLLPHHSLLPTRR